MQLGFGAEVWVGRKMIKSQTRSLVRKLGASSRAQAVAEAGGLELI